MLQCQGDPSRREGQVEEAKRGAGVQTNRKECRRGCEQGAEEARGHGLQAWVKSYLEEGGEPLHRPGKEGKGTNTRMGLLSARQRSSHLMAAIFSVKLEMKSYIGMEGEDHDVNSTPTQTGLTYLGRHCHFLSLLPTPYVLFVYELAVQA